MQGQVNHEARLVMQGQVSHEALSATLQGWTLKGVARPTSPWP